MFCYSSYIFNLSWYKKESILRKAPVSFEDSQAKTWVFIVIELEWFRLDKLKGVGYSTLYYNVTFILLQKCTLKHQSVEVISKTKL